MRRFERCIGGYAGCGNLGDDAILQAYLENLSREDRRRTVVLSGDPRRDGRRFGVKCVGRKDPFGMAVCFLRSERFLCGGGSLLQNGTGNLSLRYYLGLLWLARLCGCKTEILAGGVGPLRGEWAEKAVARALRKCDRIGLRDEDSRRWLEERGIPTEKMTVEEDPALRLRQPDGMRTLYLKKEAGIPLDRPYICAVLRSGDGGCLQAVEDALKRLAAEDGVMPVFLVFDTAQDAEITRTVCKNVGGITVRLREAADGLAVIGGSVCLLSMRLHGLIFSAAAGVPAVGISPTEDEPKLASFCAAHSIPHFTPSQLTVEKVVGVAHTRRSLALHTSEGRGASPAPHLRDF